jgi:hypothetical protein
MEDNWCPWRTPGVLPRTSATVLTTSNPSQLIPDPGTVVIFRRIQEISWYLPRIRVLPEMIKSCYGLLVVGAPPALIQRGHPLEGDLTILKPG